jgi:hypothetical protein
VGSLRGWAGGSADDGAVYVFNADPGFGGNREMGKYAHAATPPGPKQFSYNMDINGQTLVATEAFGRSYAWPIGGIPAPLPGSEFNSRFAGDGISVSDDYIALGYSGHGVVSLYDKAGRLLRNLTPPPGSPYGFGTAVAIEGNLLVVSASGRTAGASRTFIYRVQDVLVPEPSALVGLMTGIAGLFAFRRRLCALPASA